MRASCWIPGEGLSTNPAALDMVLSQYHVDLQKLVGACREHWLAALCQRGVRLHAGWSRMSAWLMCTPLTRPPAA